MRLRTLILPLTLLAVAACATSPTGRRQIMLVSDSQMSEMGIAAYRDMQKKLPATKDAKASGYVNCVANAITREVGGKVTWEVTVFEDKQVNAFALPGGKIGVFTGLLKVANTPDQLAAVVGHEIAHVLAKHSHERVSEGQLAGVGSQVAGAVTGIDPQLFGLATNVFFLMPHSRDQESEADIMGLDLMSRAGFNPAQAVNLWQNMSKAGGGKPPEMLSTHPSDQTRIADIQKRLPKVTPQYEAARAAGKQPNCTPA